MLLPLQRLDFLELAEDGLRVVLMHAEFNNSAGRAKAHAGMLLGIEELA
jgi:hypothetical protein